jgi:hypothetical protein
MKHLKEFSAFNEAWIGKLGEFAGNVQSKIMSGVTNFAKKFSLTGNDEDLANNILTYIKSIPEDYDPNERYNKGQILRPDNTDYFIIFSDKIFPNNSAEFRVDIVKASDPKLHIRNNNDLQKEPFRIIISKIIKSDGPSTSQIGVLKRHNPVNANRRNRPSGEVGQTSTPNVGKVGESVKIECSQVIAKKIFDLVKHKWELTNANTKGDARGGQNTNQRQPNSRGRNLTWGF